MAESESDKIGVKILKDVSITSCDSLISPSVNGFTTNLNTQFKCNNEEVDWKYAINDRYWWWTHTQGGYASPDNYWVRGDKPNKHGNMGIHQGIMWGYDSTASENGNSPDSDGIIWCSTSNLTFLEMCLANTLAHVGLAFHTHSPKNRKALPSASYAWDDAVKLPGAGFKAIGFDSQKLIHTRDRFKKWQNGELSIDKGPQIGDICLEQSKVNTKHQHASFWNGKYWVSDCYQSNEVVGLVHSKKYLDSSGIYAHVEIFRLQGCTPQTTTTQETQAASYKQNTSNTKGNTKLSPDDFSKQNTKMNLTLKKIDDGTKSIKKSTLYYLYDNDTSTKLCYLIGPGINGYPKSNEPKIIPKGTYKLVLRKSNQYISKSDLTKKIGKYLKLDTQSKYVGLPMIEMTDDKAYIIETWERAISKLNGWNECILTSQAEEYVQGDKCWYSVSYDSVFLNATNLFFKRAMNYAKKQGKNYLTENIDIGTLKVE